MCLLKQYNDGYIENQLTNFFATYWPDLLDNNKTVD